MKRAISVTSVCEILNSYKIGDRVLLVDHVVLISILKNHPNAAEKIGVGVDHFSIGNGDYGTRCFYIHRIDGTVIDFSYIACFRKKNEFNSAARIAVEPSIHSFRLTLPETFVCPIDGFLLTRFSCHIDHAPPYTFQHIVKEYLEKYPINIETIKYDHSGIGNPFSDQSLVNHFRTFHDSIATLRGISKEANLSLPKL